MSDIAKRVAQLSPEKRKLFMQQFNQKRERASQTQIQPQKRETNVFPLSYAQQRLWFLDQLNPGSPAYLAFSTSQFPGVLNIQALERSLHELTRRHEILRTTFQEHDGQPVQVIHPFGNWRLPLVDLSALELVERQKAVHDLTGQERQQPCHLVAGPLLRPTLVRLTDQEHILFLTMHHIISDGWSRDVFFREARSLYQSFVAGRPSPLQPLPIQYADYALWQRQWLQGEVLERQLAYWKRQLDAITLLELPTDHPRPPVQTFNGATFITQLPVSLQEPLLLLGQRYEVTLFMILLAAFQILLARYSGQNDISVGTPIANRLRPELEGLIGFFTNTLVMRTDLSRNPTFLELLGRVREVALAAYSHQDVPFEQLVGELQPQRDLSRSPLFQVMFNMQQGLKGEMRERHQEEVIPGELVSELTTTKFDLTLTVASHAHGLRCEFEYNTDLFDATTIDRLQRHWQCLLEGIVTKPEARLADLPLLTIEEQRLLLIQWNATMRPLPEATCFHQLVEEQAERSADAVALLFNDHHLTYEALNDLSNCLAVMLQRRNVGPDVLVGLWLPRSLELVVGLCAILKAGGAYVPLDPGLPVERLRLLQQEARFPLLMTTCEVAQNLVTDPLSHVQLLCLDELWIELAEHRGYLPHRNLSGEHLAYVLYTSGSTGIPRGVMVTHAGLLNYLSWCRDQYGLQAGRGTVVQSSIGFDLTVTSLLAPLTVGRCVVLVPETQSIEALVQILRQGHGLSLLKITPAHLDLLVQLLRKEELQGVAQALIIGGEALTAEHIANWRKEAPQIRLINEYGPTETVVGCCVYEVLAEDPSSGPVPIGRPIMNTQLYILDAHLQPVPIGVVGELYIAGTGLARGYLDKAGETAERFIAHPWSQEPGARLYRSGDLARYRPDGVIEYLGRNDQQVKLRGYRIELGEIEAIVRQHPQVRDGVVLLRQEPTGASYLVGYVAADQTQRIESQDLKDFLRRYVPEYMVPSLFVVLEELPLTANGKIDRAHLPDVTWDASAIQVSAVPRHPLEQIIAEIWEELLAISIPDVHEDFFELGGHSLLAARVISRIRTLLNVELPLRSVFEAPTIAGLAQRVQQALLGEQRPELPPLVARERGADLPLSFAQQRLWFLDQLEPGSSAYINPVVQQIQEALHLQVFERSLIEVIRRHESLRTIFVVQAGEPMQVIQPVPTSILLLIDLSGIPTAEQEALCQRLAREETGQPCDLSRGPLLRVRLLRQDQYSHRMLLSLHHIITDGWSDGILAREFVSLYHAFEAGAPSPLPELAIQYADYALWQQQWVHSAFWQQQRSYWQEQLRDLPPLELPSDYVRPPQQRFRGARLDVQLPAELVAGLKELSRRQGVTLFMTLLAAFQVLLSRYSGQTDISVGTPVANRTHAEIEGLIGFFVNTLVLRSDLSGNPTFRTLLERVREVTLGAYAHQEVPFEQLVELLQPERDLSRNPLFQVMLILQNVPMQAETEAGSQRLRMRSLPAQSTTARFDLTLSLNETRHAMVGLLEYNTDLFRASTMQRLLEHWQVLLQGIVAQPDAPVGRLPLLSSQEQTQVQQQGTGVVRALPDERLVHQLIEEQVERTPEAVALSAHEEQVSYRFLNGLANGLAHRLRTHGVGLEVPVAVLSERSIGFVIAQLAIWKANGVYVPLDVLFPRQRLSHMLQQSRCAVVLVGRASLGLLADLLETVAPEQHPQVLVIEELMGPRDQQENLPSHITPESLAYVIYTSGSTGQPKGVMVQQRGMLNHMLGKLADVHFTASDILAQNGPPCFDISVWQSLAALLLGGRVQLVSDEQAWQAAELWRQVQQKGITVLQLVPSMLRELLQEASGPDEQPVDPGALRWVVPTGDALPAEVCRRWLKVYAQIPILNTYGSTECSDDQCHHVIDSLQAEQEWTAVMSIGKPIANMQAYVLDAALQLVPVGVIGELYIGGIGVGRGYLEDGVRTAQAFVPDGYSGREGGRLYKTGDRVRMHEGGALEFLGRVDHLVKLRGNRIELGEIEAVLEQHEHVEASVVVARTNQGNRADYLAAYVVGREGRELERGMLQRYLQERLPEYMVPAQFVSLAQLPLSANGKIDRRALPVPDQEWETGVGFVAPRTPAEEVIADLWKDILGIQQVGVYDDFFLIGGYSLLATRVISRLSSIFQVELSLRSLFENHTIDGLVTEIARLYGERETVEEIAQVMKEIDQMTRDEIDLQIS